MLLAPLREADAAREPLLLQKHEAGGIIRELDVNVLDGEPRGFWSALIRLHDNEDYAVLLLDVTGS
jgi:hypothetical protein